MGASSGDTAYDITVVGPNRFLRRFTGDTAGSGAGASATAVYPPRGEARPGLVLDLVNSGASEVTFTITSEHYAEMKPISVRVAAGRSVARDLTSLLAHSSGWYDVTVTVNGDSRLVEAVHRPPRGRQGRRHRLTLP